MTTKREKNDSGWLASNVPGTVLTPEIQQGYVPILQELMVGKVSN